MRDYNKNYGSKRRDFGGRRDSRRTEMHDAICDECGKKCQVPFRPSGDKPIYCSECFEQKSDRSPRRHDGRDSRRRKTRMYQAVCDECGRKCEVPFKPTNGKPIFCDDCFKSTSGKDNRKNQGAKDQNIQKQIDGINKKLDKILQMLEPSSSIQKQSKNKDVTKKDSRKKKSVQKTDPKKSKSKRKKTKDAKKSEASKKSRKSTKKKVAKSKAITKKTAKEATKKRTPKKKTTSKKAKAKKTQAKKITSKKK
jgi:CxxC-x17-CxxC domain-containing protein